MEQRPSASSPSPPTDPAVPHTLLSPTLSHSSSSSSPLPTASFTSLPDSRSFISLEEFINFDDSTDSSTSPDHPSSASASSLHNALKPHSTPFPFPSFPSPSPSKSGGKQFEFAADKSSPFAQFQLLVKPASERRAASVLLPAAAGSSSSSSAPASSSFDSSLVPTVGEASAAARASSDSYGAHSAAVAPVPPASLLTRKRSAANRSPLLHSSSSASAFSLPDSLVPASFSPFVDAPQPAAQPAVPAWSLHSSDAVGHLASGDVDRAVYSYLLGIRAAPSHPYCRQQLLHLLLSRLRLHPTATAGEMSGGRQMSASVTDLDREVSVIDSLDNDDDASSVGSMSESETGGEWDDDEDMGIVCRPNQAERQRMLREHDNQQLYSEQQHDHSNTQPNTPQLSHQRSELHEGGKVKPHSPLLDDTSKPATAAAASTSSHSTDEQPAKAEQSKSDAAHTVDAHESLKQRMLHSYPRSLASILPQPATAAAAATVDADEDEDDEEVVENKDDYAIRLAAISYLSPDIACGLCGLFLYRPVTALCGHSFCQFCLTTYLDRQPLSSLASLSCPFPKCGEPLSSSRHVCVQLASALEKCFPSESAVAKMHSEAIGAIGAGKDEDAITFLTTALVQWPDTFPLYSTRLCCYLRLCKFDLAIADLSACIQLTQLSEPKQPAAMPSQTHSSSSPLSLTLPPFHQRSAAVQSLTALGQAGLLTRFYRLAVYSFASALRLSGADEASIVDREKVAQGLIDAYLANVNAVLADMNPVRAAVEEKQPEKPSSGVRHISSRSLLPSKPTSAPAASSSAPAHSHSQSATRGSGWFANALSSSSSSAASSHSTAPSTSASTTASPSSSSSASSSASSKSTSPTLSPSLTSFFLPLSSSAPSSSPSFHVSPIPARRRQEPYRLMVDHPTPSLVSSECVCLVCMELLYEPVTSCCGHTFCRLCLARSLDHKNLCPFCRVSLSVHISPTRQHVNVAIKALLTRWCEGRYNRRHARVTAALREQASFVPLFVCTLMFPGVRCPLHIFEPRYRLMIRSVLESGYNRFGMVVHTANESGFAPIGCTAEIRNVRLLSDGRSLVDTVGGRRFRVVERDQRNGYNVGRVEWLDDISAADEARLYGHATPSTAALQGEVWRLVHDALLPRLVNRFDLESQLGVMPAISDDSVRFAYWLCAVLPLSMEQKYQFLQLDSVWQRYSTLYTALKRLEARESL